MGRAEVSVYARVSLATGETRVCEDGLKCWKTLRWTWYSTMSSPGEVDGSVYAGQLGSAPVEWMTFGGLTSTPWLPQVRTSFG